MVIAMKIKPGENFTGKIFYRGEKFQIYGRCICTFWLVWLELWVKTGFTIYVMWFLLCTRCYVLRINEMGTRKDGCGCEVWVAHTPFHCLVCDMVCVCVCVLNIETPLFYADWLSERVRRHLCFVLLASSFSDSRSFRNEYLSVNGHKTFYI